MILIAITLDQEVRSLSSSTSNLTGAAGQILLGSTIIATGASVTSHLIFAVRAAQSDKNCIFLGKWSVLLCALLGPLTHDFRIDMLASSAPFRKQRVKMLTFMTRCRQFSHRYQLIR